MQKKLLFSIATLGVLFAASSINKEPLAVASSHREAPFITEHPKVDATDLYMFSSYETGRSDFVTIIANYQPLQDPYGGPNYFTMDPDARYDIHVDNDGDAKEDLTFRFKFKNRSKNLSLTVGSGSNTKKVAVPVINIGSISAADTSALNVIETYSVRVMRDGNDSGALLRHATTNERNFTKPVDNIGAKSIPDYSAYAGAHIHPIDIPGCATDGRMFVGQRKDPFVVNLGETFDLINLNPVGGRNVEPNDLADKNVTSLILEIPKSCLVSANSTVLGAWTTASLPKKRTLKEKPSFNRPEAQGGELVQVSRLGSPLVNEVVIGLKDKDRFNASHPRDDAQFLNYVSHPTLPEIIEILFGSAGVQAPNLFPRTDLIAVFLTGVDNLNKTSRASEMLRLNTATPPVAAASQSNLGVLGADNAGFPNGRRPGDDVVDIALRAVMGALLSASDAPSGSLPYTDGAEVSASDFSSSFPYLVTPLPGSPNS